MEGSAIPALVAMAADAPGWDIQPDVAIRAPDGGAGPDPSGPPGRGLVLSVVAPSEPQFWKDCPVEPGCVLELPSIRETEHGEETSEMAVFVDSVSEDATGLRVTVKFLGASTAWAREIGIKVFSREKKFVHV